MIIWKVSGGGYWRCFCGHCKTCEGPYVGSTTDMDICAYECRKHGYAYRELVLCKLDEVSKCARSCFFSQAGIATGAFDPKDSFGLTETCKKACFKSNGCGETH